MSQSIPIDLHDKFVESVNDVVEKDDNTLLVVDPIQELEDRIFNEVAKAEEYSQETFMLDYEKQMLLDMLHTDILTVCAKGISYEKVFLNLLRVHFRPSELILVINSSDDEEKLYNTLLGEEYVREVSNNANERERIYHQGGIQFVSTRILVVDLLKKRIPFELITGIFVLKAHQIIESCQEAFAIRLYRQNNKIGFIKAFSSSAEAFTYGYGHVEKVMRNLFITELSIWPRFHITIQKSLKPFEPQIIELQIPMTQKMTLIQTHILDLMNYTVKELKRLNRFIDMEEITVENCVTKNFHKILQSQLDTIWHQLSSNTKLLISDLKVLRSLMISTIYNDSVNAYSLIKKYRTTEYAMNNSGWILLTSAEQMFKLSRERVFNQNGEFEPEFSPKWKLLTEIIRIEIPSDLKRTAEKNNTAKDNKIQQTENVKVLILCQDARTCYQLNQYLTQGGEKYLFFSAIKNEIPIVKISEKYRQCELPDNAVKIQTLETYFTKPMTVNNKQENTTISNKRFLRDRLIKKNKDDNEAAAAASTSTSKVEDELTLLVKPEHEEDNFYKDSYILTFSQKPNTNESTSKNIPIEENNDLSIMENGEFESFSELENLDITKIINTCLMPIVCIKTFKHGINLEKTLNEINPEYIIMYHCNITAIRQIELYEGRKNRLADERVKVFFLIHTQTVEEQSYLTSLRREKQAFELLIDTKSKMVVPEYQDGRRDEVMSVLNQTEVVQHSTRQAGGMINKNELQTKIGPKIIVDMREFRSDLPCLIHKRGIEIVPVTITIGDYILTPDICVERKSISDLIGSLNSGRLYNQCVQMTRYYSKPILLIEFDQNKPFHLQGHYMISNDTNSNNDITQKLQLLTIYFPKLKLVWSPSPYSTAKLFEEIKLGKLEPDAITAAALGSDGIDNDNLTEKYNPNIYDFLIKLPGIDSRNIIKLMKTIKNMKDLLSKTEIELEEILNSKVNAKMLWEILHVSHKPVSETVVTDKAKYKRGKGGGFRRF